MLNSRTLVKWSEFVHRLYTKCYRITKNTLTCLFLVTTRETSLSQQSELHDRIFSHRRRCSKCKYRIRGEDYGRDTPYNGHVVILSVIHGAPVKIGC